MQTPQGFLLEPLIECHKAAFQKKLEFTDDTEVWDAFPNFTGGKKSTLLKAAKKQEDNLYSGYFQGNKNGPHRNWNRLAQAC